MVVVVVLLVVPITDVDGTVPGGQITDVAGTVPGGQTIAALLPAGIKIAEPFGRNIVLPATGCWPG